MKPHIETPQIETLRPVETVAFDTVKLANLCAAHGAQAESAITTILSEIDTLISVAATQRGQTSGLTRTCIALRQMADTIGMTTITRACDAVLDCIARADWPALAACTARLVRLGTPDTTLGWTMQSHPETVA